MGRFTAGCGVLFGLLVFFSFRLFHKATCLLDWVEREKAGRKTPAFRLFACVSAFRACVQWRRLGGFRFRIRKRLGADSTRLHTQSLRDGLEKVFNRNCAQISGVFRLLSIVALAIKPLARETACLQYRILNAWLYFLAMNNLLAGQQAMRRRASKAGTEEDNITPVNSTHKSKEEAPAPDWF